MKITIWKMTALLAVHLASSLLPAAGAVKGIREGDPLPCCMRAGLKGRWGERGSHCQSAPWRIHCTPLFLYIFTSYFLVWSTLRLLERIFHVLKPQRSLRTQEQYTYQDHSFYSMERFKNISSHTLTHTYTEVLGSRMTHSIFKIRFRLATAVLPPLLHRPPW